MLEGLTPKPKEAICFLLRKATAELSNDDLAILLDALDDPRWTMTSLVNALNERGFHISRGVVEKHKNKLCTCAR